MTVLWMLQVPTAGTIRSETESRESSAQTPWSAIVERRHPRCLQSCARRLTRPCISASSSVQELPVVSIVVPFWGCLIWSFIYNWLNPKDGPTMETVGTVGGHAQGTKRADTDVGPRVGNKHPTSSLRGLQPEAP